MNIIFDKKEGYLYFNITGDYTGKRDYAKIIDIIDITIRYGYSTILVNVKDLNYHFDTTQRFILSEHWVNLCRDAGWIKTAILGKKEMMDKFTENVINNRGIEFRLFSDEQEAIDWLQKRPYPLSI